MEDHWLKACLKVLAFDPTSPTRRRYAQFHPFPFQTKLAISWLTQGARVGHTCNGMVAVPMNEAIQAVRAYHQVSKHHTQSYAPGPGFLDWDTQPNPFRRYAGAPLSELPLLNSPPQTRTYAQLFSNATRAADALSPETLGLFLELALGLSAWKSTGPDRWALRNNPSSGNLHPSEGYLLLWQAASAELTPGLYHYAPHEHALERRAELPAELAARLRAAHPGCFGALGLSSVLWREAWKYGVRAYRYCQLDVGHALASARIAAQLLGWSLKLDARVSDDCVAACLGLDRAEDFGAAEREHPDLLAVLGEPGVDTAGVNWTEIAQALTHWTGSANALSREQFEWPQISHVLPALHKPDTPAPAFTAPTAPSAALADHTTDEHPTAACSLIRQRRSAQRMDGQSGMSRADFERLLQRSLPVAQRPPFDALPYPPAIQLLFFVHAIEGLEPGIYLLMRNPAQLAALRQRCSEALEWIAVPDTALPLYRLYAPLELRRTAAQLSCHQGIAGRGAFSLGMLADLDLTLKSAGAWAYRRVYWEAGMLGQLLYLEAEAAGLQGTGIGCFFDDDVHQLIGLDPEGAWQDLYHFTVGKAVLDERLQSEPAYAHLAASRFVSSV